MTNVSRSRYSTSILVLAAAFLLPASAAAQDGFLYRPPAVTLSFRMGQGGPTANGELFDFFTNQLTLKRGDFRSTTVAADLGINAGPRAELVFGFAHDASSNRSEFRDWEDNNNQPIEQTTEIKRTPLTVSAKYYLVPRGRSLAKHAWIPQSFTPYVSGGGGLMLYELDQNGDWVDYQTLDVFARSFHSSGSGLTAHLGAGAEYWFSTHLGLSADGRYAWGTAKLHGDFTDFDRIDLRGFQVTTGLSVRF